MIEDVLEALKEWRDARLAFFEQAHKTIGMVPRQDWDRLANAEHALMDIARKLP